MCIRDRVKGISGTVNNLLRYVLVSGLAAVSYTHLDVYKRQVDGGAGLVYPAGRRSWLMGWVKDR